MHQPQIGDEWEVPMEKEVNQGEGDEPAEFTSMGVTANCTAVEEYIEFWPVEHPLEPPNDDRPVKCPMANSSAINGRWSMSQERVPPNIRRISRIEDQGRWSMSQERVPPNIRRISRIEDMKKKMAKPVNSAANHLVRKRHYSITDGDIILTPVRITPPRPSDSTALFQMCQGIDRFKTKSTSQL